MPRVTREQTEANRAAITTASARLFRERGIDGVSVADLMAAAGLTHGGFYGHFASKDAIAAAACAAAFEQSDLRWKDRVGKTRDGAARNALIEPYLSTRSRGSHGTGCPIVALATDVARQPAGAPIRGAYLAGLEGLLEILASTEATGDDAVDRRLALADLATMVGALVLARATTGSELSDEVLAAARERLIEGA